MFITCLKLNKLFFYVSVQIISDKIYNIYLFCVTCRMSDRLHKIICSNVLHTRFFSNLNFLKNFKLIKL